MSIKRYHLFWITHGERRKKQRSTQLERESNDDNSSQSTFIAGSSSKNISQQQQKNASSKERGEKCLQLTFAPNQAPESFNLFTFFSFNLLLCSWPMNQLSSQLTFVSFKCRILHEKKERLPHL